MADINLIINRRTGEENQIARFDALSAGVKDKKKLRDLEMHLLKPSVIPKYKGPKSGKTNFEKCSLLFVFPSPQSIARLSKFITINTYMENNTYNVEFLMELIKLMERERIKWNSISKKFYMVTKTGKKIKL